MRAFKKRTIALVLASVVTVVGAFGAENYKNSLMGLSFSQNEEGLNLVLQTRVAHESDIVPMKRDQNTYVVMLPEMDSRAITPNLNKVAGCVSSVDIQTMPYSNGSKGYTRITIKTAPSTILGVEKQVFIPGESYKYLETSSLHGDNRYDFEQERRENEPHRVSSKNQASSSSSPESDLEQQRVLEQKKQQAAKEALEQARKREAIAKAKRRAAAIQKANEENQKTVSEVKPKENLVKESEPVKKAPEPVVSDDYYEDNNQFTYVLAAILLLGLIAYFIVKAKNKLHELTGENIVIDVSDDEEIEKQKKVKKAKEEVKKAEKKSKSETPTLPVVPEFPYVPTNSEEFGAIETVDVVDLDEIFKEQSKNQSTLEDEENKALEDFLSGFSFDEEMLAEEEEYSPGYDVEFYEKFINSSNCMFSNEDVEKINKLLNMEINDSTLKNIEKYAVSNPIKKQPSRKQILEELVTTYAISQNVTFTKDDVGALYKLISVEIDSDFITDLKTNPQRVKEMEQELAISSNKTKKPTEILTLNVKDVLPDLSEALRKQGKRAIQSEVKPQTVYYSEGYEVSKLSLDSEVLPDLSVEINNDSAYVSKPSCQYDLVDNSYDVSRLKISNQLPDLMDMLQNPDKYKKEETPVEVNEEDLLNNIANVQFKPFYEGQDFEVLNNKEDFEEASVIDIQKELSQFDNIEIVNDDSERVFDELNIQEVDSLYEENSLGNTAEQAYLSEKDVNNFEDKEVSEEVSAVSLEELLAVENISSETKDAEDFVQKDEIIFEDLNKNNDNEHGEQKEAFNHNIELSENQEKTLISQEAEKVNGNISHKKALSKEHSKKLLRRIEDVKSKRIERNERINSSSKTVLPTTVNDSVTKVIADIKCIYEGETYTVVSTAPFDAGAGCYLAKNEKGYMVLGYYGDKLFNLKQYDSLKSEKIQTRLTEKLSDNSYRYLVRIGINKFVVEVSGENISYVMELC